MSGLFHMPPGSANYNLVERGDRHAKAVGKFAIDHPFGTQTADFSNITFCKWRAPVMFPSGPANKSQSECMPHVIQMCAPLKVSRAIVQFVAVNVVGDMIGCRRWASKRLKNKAMHDADGAASVSGQASLHVAPVPQVLGKNSASSFSQTAAHSNVFTNYSSDAGLIGNLMRRLKAENWLPYFVFHSPNLANFTQIVNPVRS